MRLLRLVVGGLQVPLAFLTILWLAAFWDAGETHIYGLAGTSKVVLFICAAPMPALAFRLLGHNLFWQAKTCLFLSIPLLLLLALGLLRHTRWGSYMGLAVFLTNAAILMYDLVDDFRFGFIHVYSLHGLEVLLHWIFLLLYASTALYCLLEVRRFPKFATTQELSQQ